ncbi:MAG: GIY-YIG nuclease family protein [Breznakia sp.]
MYYIYILRCSDNTLYTGITKNMQKRMKEHCFKHKNGAKYTKTRDIIALEAVYSCDNRSLALKLEYKIKQYSKKQKEEILQNPQILTCDEYTIEARKDLKDYLK